MTEKIVLQYVEIDLTPCGLTYGVYPCTAQLGVTGTYKCYNSPATCQVPQAFSATTPKTHRFSVPSEDLPRDIDCIPNILKIDVRSQEIKPGESMGTRESVTVTFQNHKHNDSGFDNYLSDRGFNTFNNGTFWGKFFARWPNLQGKPLRLIYGEPGQTLEEMETFNYFIEETRGPDFAGKVQIIAKDALKFLDGKKGQAPSVSGGRLLSAITNSDTSATLTPTGIGDSEYPASGTATIGDEIVTFTRSGDTLTLSARGLYGSDQEEHDADETVQIALVYTAEDPADIVNDLIFNYTDTPASYADLTNWQNETASYYGRLLSAIIVRPMPVRELVSELIEHANLLIYTDVKEEKIKLSVLRPKTAVANFTEDNVNENTFKFVNDESKRINAIWIYYGQRNPLRKLDEDGNFKSIVAEYDDDPVKALEDLPLAIREIRSRWILNSNRAAAEQLQTDLLNRYGETPGEMGFRVPHTYPLTIGNTITLKSRIFEDAQGTQETTPRSAIITQLEKSAEYYTGKAIYFNFRLQDVTTRTILIDESQRDFNLRTAHDLIYQEPQEYDTVNVIISEGVIIGATSYLDFFGNIIANNAFDVGSWPANVAINITNLGRVQGVAGYGAVMSWTWFSTEYIATYQSPATDGGNAFYTRYPVSIDNTDGEIWGGGAGAGVAIPARTTFQTQPLSMWGGCGQGDAPISGYSYRPGYASTSEAPGAPAATKGATGGGPGQDGNDGVDYYPFYSGFGASARLGATAGTAVDGDSYITWAAVGDIQGNQIN